MVEILQTFKSISIPPLKKRQEDIPLLAEYYLAKFCNQYPRSIIRCLDSEHKINPKFNELIANHHWRENVNDLIAYLHSMVILPYSEELNQPEKLKLSQMLTMIEVGNEFSLPASLSKIEQGIIERSLKKHKNHQAKAAQALGITDRDIRRKVSKSL